MSSTNSAPDLAFLSPKFITEPINGSEVKFYSVSVSKMFTIRVLARPLSMALGELFRKADADQTIEQRDMLGATAGGGTAGEFIKRAVEPGLAAERFRQRNEVIDAATNVLLSEECRDVMLGLIADAMRDVCPKRGDKTEIEMLRKMDGETFFACLVAVGRANKDIFDPFLDALVPGLKDKIKGKLADVRKSLEQSSAGAQPPKPPEVGPLPHA